MGAFAAFEKVGDDDVVRVVFLSVGEELFEKPKIVVVDIEIYDGVFAEGGDERVVEDLFMGAEFVKKEEDAQGLVEVGVLDEVSFTRYGSEYAHFLQVFITFFRGVAGDL